LTTDFLTAKLILMEKFTLSVRTHAPDGCTRSSRRYAANLQKQRALLLFFAFSLLGGGALLAQPFTLVTGSANPLNGADAGSRSVPVFVDIDNDCDRDLFVGNADGEILYYRNTGTASAPVFVLQAGSGNPLDGQDVGSNAKPAFADLDDDGDLDCFVGALDGTIRTYRNTGTVSAPTFQEEFGLPTAGLDGNPFDGEDVGANASPVFLDFDGDGDLDCFVGRSQSTNSIRYFRNEGDIMNPVYTELTGANLPAGTGNPLSNALLGGVGASGDINSNACLTGVDFGVSGISTTPDGDIDIYVGVTNGTFRYFRNQGGSFNAYGSGSGSSPLDNTVTKDISGSLTDYSSPTFVDIDGDGDMDCFSGRTNGEFVFYRNDAPAAPRTVACAPYIVNLNALSGTVTVNPATVDPDDLYASSTFTCPAELTLTVSGTVQNFTCAAADNTFSPASNGAADGSTLTLTATDGAGNTATCAASIFVRDITPPVPTLATLAAQVRDLCTYNTGTGQFTPSLTVPTASDVCDGGPTAATHVRVNSGPTVTVAAATANWTSAIPAGFGTLGTYTLTWTYTDGGGYTSTQVQTLNIVSNAPPTWGGCPANITAPAPNTTTPSCGYLPGPALWTAPVAVDCDLLPASVVSSHTPTSFFPVGSTNVTYSAQDAGGNTGFCNFTVTVTDNTAPTATATGCPTPAAVNAPTGQCSATVSWTAPSISASDNCGGTPTITVSHPSGSSFPVGTTTVRYIATDAYGNSNSTFCTFNVVVNDVQVPTITCPSSITIPTAPNSCTSATVNLTLPPASDNCTYTVVETESTYTTTTFTGPRSVSGLPLGQTAFYYRVTDASGNSATCSFIVNVTDQQAPSFGSTCPSDQEFNFTNGTCSSPASWVTPTATDNCSAFAVTGPVFTPQGNTVPPTGTTATSGTFNEGTTTVTYTVVDGVIPPAVFGFTGALQTYTVPAGVNSIQIETWGAEGGSGAVGAPASSTGGTPGLGGYAKGTLAVTPGQVLNIFVGGQGATPAGGYNGGGSGGSTDAGGGGGASDVRVGGVAEASRIITAGGGGGGGRGGCETMSSPGGTGGAGGGGVGGNGNDSPTSGGSAGGGRGGNFGAVQGAAGAAGIGCAGFLGSPGLVASTGLGANGGDGQSCCCFAFPTIFPGGGGGGGGQLGGGGGGGGSAGTVGCSGNDKGAGGGGGGGSSFVGSLSSTMVMNGVRSGNGQVIITPASSGLTATCSFTIKVTNTTPPSITCPANTSVTPVQVTAGANCLYTLGTAASFPVTSTATAPCDPGIISFTTTGGSPLTIGTSTFGLGTHTLVANATDAGRNTATCSFNIQVVDLTGPTLTNTCPANITVNSDVAASCGANVTWTAPVWTDNCNPTGIIVSKVTTPVGMTPNTATLLSGNNGGYFPVGTTQVNFTAKDGPAITANVGTPCGFTVTVVDDDRPVITCPTSPISLSTTFPTCNASYTLATPTVTDYGCTTTYTVSYTVSSPSTALGTFPLATPGSVTLLQGDNIIRYQVQDAAANTGTCSYTVQVRDLQAPSFSCPSSQIIVLTSGCSGPATNWMDPTSTSDCTLPVVISAPSIVGTTGSSVTPSLSGTPSARNGIFPVGVTTIRYTATDAAPASNSSTCTFTIDVRENVAPTISCPSPITVGTEAGVCTRTFSNAYMLGLPTGQRATASDACSVPALSTNIIGSVTYTAPSNFSVTWTATDAAGNTATCTQTVQLRDLQPPTLSCAPYSVQVDVPGNNFIPSNAPSFLPKSQITVSDNCASLSLASVTASPALLPQYPVGVSFINWQVSDGSTTVTCVQQVTVTPNATCTPSTPSFALSSNCGNNTPVSVYSGPCPATVTVTPAALGVSATDNCGNALTVGNQFLNITGSGNQIVTFTATVGANTVSCARTVSVNCTLSGPCSPDVTDPLLSACPAAVTLSAEPGEDFALSSNLPQPTATDACPGTVTLDNDAADEIYDGDIVTWIATDAAGNDATCVQTITVIPDNPGGAGCFDEAPGSPEVAFGAASGDLFGNSVDVDGNFAIIGAPFDDNVEGINSGIAYIFQRSGSNWSQIAELKPTDIDADDYFGESVAIEGDLVIVGAPNYAGRGAAFVYKRDAGNPLIWTLLKRLDASDGSANDNFGMSVDITATHAIVGAPDDDAPEVNRGSAYIFERSLGGSENWGQLHRRNSTDGATNDNFGISVSLSGGNAVVGARYDDEPGTNTGAAFVFGQNQGGANNWGQVQKLLASDRAPGDYFGFSVAISGNTIVVGSYLDDIGLSNNIGSAYIFAFSGGSWAQTNKLTASDGAASDQFGYAVDIDGGTVLVGAHFDDDMGTNSGSAYAFTQGGGWLQTDKLTGSAASTNDNFGHSVAVDGGTAVVGAYKDDFDSGVDQGSAYFFEDDCSSLRDGQVDERADAKTPNNSARCFPNPSRDMVQIAFNLEEEETVQVRISDAAGRIVSTLFDGKASGEQLLQWEGQRFGGGMYFVRIESASLQKVFPIVILK
jgi:hypothetical protein